jgi:hypothetical protein
VLYDSTIIVLFLLHFLFLHVELQFDLVVCINFKSPSNLCLSPFYHSSLEKTIPTNLNIYNIFLFINES